MKKFKKLLSGETERICVWAEFIVKGIGKRVYVFNSHFPGGGHKKTRKASARAVGRKIIEIAGNTPAVFMGDLNSGEILATNNLKMTLPTAENAKYLAGNRLGEKGSVTGFNEKKAKPGLLDHFFVNDPRFFNVHLYAIIKRNDNKPMSDHRSIIILADII